MGYFAYDMVRRLERLPELAKDDLKLPDMVLLLATGAIRLEEIAERLGYGEVSNFIHAFKRWKGLPPSQYLLSRNRATKG